MPSLIRRNLPNIDLAQQDKVNPQRQDWDACPAEIKLKVIASIKFPIDLINLAATSGKNAALTIDHKGTVWLKHGIAFPLVNSLTPQQAWLQQFRLQPTLTQEMYIEVNSSKNIFSKDEMHLLNALTSAIEAAISSIKRGNLSVAQKKFSAACDLAKQEEQKIPTRIYMSAMRTCIEKAIWLNRRSNFRTAKDAFSTAFYIAEKADQTVPPCDYGGAMGAWCVERGIRLAEAHQWQTAKKVFTAAAYFAEKADQTILPSDYASAMDACVNCAVDSAQRGVFAAIESDFTAAAYFAEKAGRAVPPSDYERAMDACVDWSVVVASKGLYTNARATLGIIPWLAQRADTPVPQKALDLQSELASWRTSRVMPST